MHDPETPPAQQMAIAQRFRDLHERPQPFVIPNPWDVGSARLLATAGFDALATTSAGAAASMGRPDGSVERAAMIDHVATIAAATDLPVSADLESGFGADPEVVASTIVAAAAAGAVGGSIEDLRAPGELRPLGDAAERVAAAVAAARSLPHDFVLTARCEQMLTPRRDLAEAIDRLQAYQDAGADVLYAPGLTTSDDVHAVVTSLDRPVNVVMGLGASVLTVADLAELGVRRISLGSAFARAAYGALLRAAREVAVDGTFTFAAEAVPYAQLNEMLARSGAGAMPDVLVAATGTVDR